MVIIKVYSVIASVTKQSQGYFCDFLYVT